MDQAVLYQVLNQDFLDTLLPAETSDQFFEALYGDAMDGAYDIRLEYISANDERIVLAYNLTQRPGKCLVCSLTYGLPKVFSRHPLINIDGMIEKMGAKDIQIKSWRMGETEEQTSQLHSIPLYLELE